MAFEKTYHVSWAHLDSNGHMANTAYLDIVVDARFMYFTERGFPPAEFARLRIGPVVRRDEVDYYRELRMLQMMTVNFMLAGISEDASRFRIVNEVRGEDGELAARVASQGGWFDLNARKLIAPPERLAEALRSLEHFGNFEILASSLKK